MRVIAVGLSQEDGGVWNALLDFNSLLQIFLIYLQIFLINLVIFINTFQIFLVYL